jgi:hypothetical protein
MQIEFKPFKGNDRWEVKCYGVIFVKTEADRHKLHKLLCAQDSYWESYLNVIKIIPTGRIDSVKNLDRYCEYVGNIAIHDIVDMLNQVDFLIYQNLDC